jgi:hypothetical protein
MVFCREDYGCCDDMGRMTHTSLFGEQQPTSAYYQFRHDYLAKGDSRRTEHEPPPAALLHLRLHPLYYSFQINRNRRFRRLLAGFFGY